MCSQSRDEYQSIKSELLKLQNSLTEYEKSARNPSAQPKLVEIQGDPDVEHDIHHIETSRDNYLSELECSELMSALSDLPYTNERGRSTMKFGENYSYNGSRNNNTVEYPDCVSKLLKKLNTDFGKENVPPLNSCLVTKYVGPNAYIPPHSDDERSIHPESSIITVSLGVSAEVVFTDNYSGAVSKHVTRSGSLYSMTRKSQGFYKHSISKNSAMTENEMRISLTFRSVHWRNNNSTVILGDSNTGGLKFAKFGEEPPTDFKGTFGNAMPGKRVEAFTIKELDPIKCVGYNNVVVHCGVNDIKNPEVKSLDHVRDVYAGLKHKVSQIMRLNKRAKVSVSLLLPTKHDVCNEKVSNFNKFLSNDLGNSFDGKVRIIDHFRNFTDHRGQLSQHLSRDVNRSQEPDWLHLNEAGLRVLSVAIKNSIFEYKRESRDRGSGGQGSGGTGQQSRQSSYAGAVAHGRPQYRRGGSANRGQGRNRR